MKSRKTQVPVAESTAGSQAVKEFNLTLPMTVSGLDARGQEFRENSQLATISSEQASFLLKTRVERQTLLKLVIALPPKLADGQPLALVIRGRVLTIESVAGEPEKKKILLGLDSRYFIGVEEG